MRRCLHGRTFTLPSYKPFAQSASYRRYKIPTGSGCTRASRRLLYLSPVWPEPSSSAAGVRTAFLIGALQETGWQVFYLSASRPNAHTQVLEQTGCETFFCPPNREAKLAEVIARARPDVCIFDRFIAEEAYSFVVHRDAPTALTILDLQDLHSLRRAREASFRRDGVWNDLTELAPREGSDLLRELASIHRCDIIFVCSPVEMQLLIKTYQLPEEKLQLAPFFVDRKKLPANKLPSFQARQHIVTIGNFRHRPNVDSILWLAEELWPTLRSQLPDGTQLHCYGAYPTAAIQQKHDPGNSFYIKGHTKSLDILAHYRLCLAPLRFGAGLKGKIVDSWQHGLPVVTTPIGAEGLIGSPLRNVFCCTHAWGGILQASSSASFVECAVTLYRDEEKWTAASNAGRKLVTDLFASEHTLPPVMEAIEHGLANKDRLRQDNLVGNILWLQKNRATEYFSRWIELKERFI